MYKDDLIRFRHMLDAAKEAISFIKGKKRRDLDTDRMLVLSLVKSIEIMGEAASKVTKEPRDSHPEVPWLNIIGMSFRNRLPQLNLASKSLRLRSGTQRRTQQHWSGRLIK